jgi:hypothetical protein
MKPYAGLLSLSFRHVLKNRPEHARLPGSQSPPASAESLSHERTPSGRRRVAAVFGLTLLEVLQQQDRPSEVLEDENVSETMPRRLGLSEVVDRQVRTYREAVRKRRRMGDDEMQALVQLVIRRPDSEDIFRRTGRLLAGALPGKGPEMSRRRRLVPSGFAYALARREVRKGLRGLFGRKIGGFAPGPFALEGRSLLFIQTDPGGDACAFLSGFCQTVLERRVDAGCRVVHAQCQSRGDEICRWTVTADARARAREGVGDLLRGPELEAS